MTGVLLPLEVPVRIGREEAALRAAEELAKAKYGGTPQWLLDLAERGEALARLLADLLARLFGGPAGAGGGISWGFVIAVLLLLAAIALVVWRVGVPRWRARRRDAAVELEPARPAEDYRNRSEGHAAAGAWTEAVRDRFRAVVRELEVATILDVRPARTAWEAAYRASRALPDCADALRAGAETFNAVLYGDRPATEADYRRLVALDEQVVASAARADLAADEGERAGTP